MTEVLFDIAWWVPVVVIVIGVVVTVAGNNRQKAGVRNGGLVVVLVGVGWLVLSFVVETPAKLCVKQTRGIVQAVSDGDWGTFEGMLDPKVMFHYVGRPWQAAGKKEVVEGTKTTVKHAGLHSASCGHLKATREGEKITVGFVGYIDSELTPGHPIDSDWEFDFRESGGKWLLTDMRVSRVDDTQPEGIRESLNKK